MSKELLLQRCRCTAYLKKIWDGACIQRLKPSETETGREEFELEYGNHAVPDDAPRFSPCEGAYDYCEPEYGKPFHKVFKEPNTASCYGPCVPQDSTGFYSIRLRSLTKLKSTNRKD